MDSVIARVSSPSEAVFEDGFGQRRLAVGINGNQLEVLTLRDELTAAAVVEAAVADRVGRLADFQSEHFGRVRSLERSGKSVPRLAVVSDHVPGIRLSTILAAAERHLLPVEINAALCLLRQLVHAIAVLHDKAPDICHGAIGPERLILTPHARLVVVEYVFGSAIERLRYSNKQYWQDLRVPIPRSFGMPHFDRRTDVMQVGATALALVIGRPMAEDEFPGQISEMTANALALSSDGALEPLPLPLRVWLQRALQIDSKTPFGSAPEAWAELDRVLHYSDPIAEMDALKRFISRYHAAVGIEESPQQAVPQPTQAPAASIQTPVKPSKPVVVPSTSNQASPVSHAYAEHESHTVVCPAGISGIRFARVCFAHACAGRGFGGDAATGQAGSGESVVRVLEQVDAGQCRGPAATGGAGSTVGGAPAFPLQARGGRGSSDCAHVGHHARRASLHGCSRGGRRNGDAAGRDQPQRRHR